MKFNKKVDIWALGCILFEVSTGRKAFESDLAAMMFEILPDIAFPAWFTKSQTTVVQYWINAMIQREPDKRPSVRQMGEKLSELFTVQVLALPSGLTENRPHSSVQDSLLIQPGNVLGGIGIPWLHGELRWETVVRPGTFVQHEKTLQRYERFVRARTTLLGCESPYTLAMMSIWAWTAFYLGVEVETASEWKSQRLLRDNWVSNIPRR
jgi:serine/threonine protein kinase